MKWQRPCGSNACVEVAFEDGNVHIRDSKHPDRQALTFTHEEWKAFAGAVKAGTIGEEPDAGRTRFGPNVDTPAANLIALLNACHAGDVEWDEELHGSVWTVDGTRYDVSGHVHAADLAGLLYRSLHSNLWRPTGAGREAIDRSGI